MFSSCCNDVCVEESCDSSKVLSSCDKVEYVEIPVVEVFCQGEEVCDGHSSDFSDYVTNGSTVSSFSSYLDDNHS